MEDFNNVYLIFHKSICRINLNNLSGENPPPIEKVVEFQKQGLPLGMGFFVLDSKLYATGGEKLLKDAEFDCPLYNGPHLLDVSQSDGGLNTNVFVFDPSHPAIPFKVDNNIPAMHAGKINAKVSTIDGKVYIFSGFPYGFDKKFPTPQFECFHPTTNKWEKLSDPPFYRDTYGRKFNHFEHYVMGGNILVNLRFGTEIYDVDGREWRDSTLFESPEVPYPFSIDGCLAEGDDGLAIAWTRSGLVAYVNHSDDTLMRYQILNDLNDKFLPSNIKLCFHATAGFILPLGCGKYCFVLSIYCGEGKYMWSIHIATFQVKTRVGTDNEGEDFLNAVLLHHHIYDGYSFGTGDPFHPRDVLIIREHSKKRGSASECMELSGGFKKKLASLLETQYQPWEL